MFSITLTWIIKHWFHFKTSDEERRVDGERKGLTQKVKQHVRCCPNMLPVGIQHFINEKMVGRGQILDLHFVILRCGHSTFSIFQPTSAVQPLCRWFFTFFLWFLDHRFTASHPHYLFLFHEFRAISESQKIGRNARKRKYIVYMKNKKYKK